jgi:hypothetical protein
MIGLEIKRFTADRKRFEELIAFKILSRTKCIDEQWSLSRGLRFACAHINNKGDKICQTRPQCASGRA